MLTHTPTSFQAINYREPIYYQRLVGNQTTATLEMTKPRNTDYIPPNFQLETLQQGNYNAV